MKVLILVQAATEAGNLNKIASLPRVVNQYSTTNLCINGNLNSYASLDSLYLFMLNKNVIYMPKTKTKDEDKAEISLIAKKLSKDAKQLLSTALPEDEVRLLLRQFYQIQKARIKFGNHLFSLTNPELRVKGMVSKLENKEEEAGLTGVEQDQLKQFKKEQEHIDTLKEDTKAWEARLQELQKKYKVSLTIYDELEGIEKQIYYGIGYQLTASPRYTMEASLLQSIRGIGPVLTMNILSILPVEKFDTFSKLRAYIYGKIDPTTNTAIRRSKGVAVSYNPFAKTLAFKIADSLIKQNKVFHDMMVEFKDRELIKLQADPANKGKKGLKAWALRRGVRKAMQAFLGAYWMDMRAAKKLPVPDIYVKAELGHTNLMHLKDLHSPKRCEAQKGF